ncbi:hypothetical protein [Ensifer aridi]|uniref:hypothetical protein n=1 Tax=Ensifer aridi TaxID=1708715 RepID=UPI000A11413C|nr:hypothetical protein [Ensifer aridi]
MNHEDIYEASPEEITAMIEIAKASPDGPDDQFIRFLECCHAMSVAREDDARHLEELLAIVEAEPDQQLWL